MSRRAVAGILLAALLPVASACASAGSSGDGPRWSSPSDPAPLPATTPYLVMTGGGSGWAVWRAGTAWLLLHTGDGFRHVSNRTPVAVPTDGGLVGSFTGSRIALAVEASERLLRSPVVTSSVGGPAWRPQELPQAVGDARNALSIGPGPETAVTAASGGTLLAEVGQRWVRRTDATALSGSGSLRLDSVVWANASVGWLTGHGSAGLPDAFVTRDAGATWRPVAATTPSSVAALAPCGAGPRWVLPVLDANGTLTMFRTVDGGITWTAGMSVRQPDGSPAWGCAGDVVWAVVGTGTGDHLDASADGGRTWTDRGAVPAGVTALVPTADGRGFAATGGDQPRIWSVSAGGSRFTPIPLPPWVDALGRQMSGS